MHVDACPDESATPSGAYAPPEIVELGDLRSLTGGATKVSAGADSGTASAI